MKTSLTHHVTLTVTLLCCLGLITGCASSEQMQQVETRVDSQYQTQQQIRQQLVDQTKAMQNLVAVQNAFEKQQSQKMQAFTNAYSPEVRAELTQNLIASTDHRNEVARLLATSKHDREQIAKMLSASSRELAIIKQNRKESDVVNVVNQFEKLLADFNKLNRHWDTTVTQMQIESDKHSDAVKSSTQAVNAALAEATNARSAADQAVKHAREVQTFQLRIIELERQLKRTRREVDRLERELDSTQRDTRSVEHDVRSLKQKVQSHSHGS